MEISRLRTYGDLSSGVRAELRVPEQDLGIVA
jgi:hypothetical protein